jgi:Spy/CpxP family protein refolding chaperone
MKCRATIVLSAVLLAASAPLALAQPPGGGPRGDRGPHGDQGPGRHRTHGLTEFLELTDEQREAWESAHRAHFEALRPTFEEIRALREQIEAELAGDAPDAATVGGFVIAIHDLEGELEAAREDFEASLRDILDDEQERKLEAWKAANPGRRHGPGFDGPGWGGPRHGGPGPGERGPR